MNRNIIIGLIIMLAGVAAGWYLLSGNPTSQLPSLSGLNLNRQTGTPSPTTGSLGGSVDEKVGSPSVGSEKGGVAARTVVTYTDSGFGPSSIVVKVGTIVTFVNESGKVLWVASGQHPSHLLLPGFDQLKSVGKGGTYEYTFAKIGTWRYHNHMTPSDTGTVVVTQ